MTRQAVIFTWAVFVLAAGPAGCTFRVEKHDHHHQPPGRPAPAPVVPCAHSRTCGHCYDEERGAWIKIAVSHVHGPGCGHEFNGHYWVIAKGARPAARPVPQVSPRSGMRTAHSHSPTCGCIYDRGRWIALEGHVHGEGCGHVFINGRWMIKK